MFYQYTYFTLCLILAVFWLLIFGVRKDLRREMLWASFLGLPFGIIDYFLVPEYWHPQSLFSLMEKYGVGIESFLFLFLMAGLVSVVYEFLAGVKTKKMAGRRKKILFLPLLASVILFLVLTAFLPQKAIYNFMLAGLVGALAVIFLRRDLLKQIIFSSFIFSFLYFVSLFFVNQIFPGFVESSYNLKNTLGVLIYGVPLEEIGVAFFVGAFWSTFYECAKSYREKK